MPASPSPAPGGGPRAPPPFTVPLEQKLVVGGLAGVLGTSIVFPLDFVKTRLQNQKAPGAGGGAARYAGPLDVVRKVVAAEGVGGLYAGLRPNLVGVAPEKALKLAVNDTLRERFTAGNGDGRIALWQEVASGGTAGFVQVAATNPMEIVKLRLQLASEGGAAGAAGAGGRATVASVVRELGLVGLYKGTPATWLRDVPFSFIFFPLFANLKVALDGDRSMAGLFAAGALAGSSAAGLVTPCDVVKTRLQVAGSPYRGIADAFTRIVAEEGAGALWKGVAPRMAVQAPLFGITLFAFDVQKKWLLKRHEEAQRAGRSG